MGAAVLQRAGAQVGCVPGRTQGSSSPGCPVPAAPWAHHHPCEMGKGLATARASPQGWQKAGATARRCS